MCSKEFYVFKEFLICHFHWIGIYGCIGNLEDHHKGIHNQLRDEPGNSSIKYWPEIVMKLWHPPKTYVLGAENSHFCFCFTFLVFCFFFENFNRFASFRFCYLSKDSKMCNWKIKRIWQVREPEWEAEHIDVWFLRDSQPCCLLFNLQMHYVSFFSLFSLSH